MQKAVPGKVGVRAVWAVEYEEGELEARAPGAEDRLFTPGAAVRLRVRADRTTLPADGTQVLQLEAELLDERGCPAKDETVFCQVLGDLTLLGLENGQPDDLTPYSESFRMTREGTLTAYFRAGSVPGSASVHLRTAYSGLTAVHRICLSEIP